MSQSIIRAVYAGTFDPITRGHEDIIERAQAMFDQVVVAVAIAHHKKTLFSLEERLAQVRQSAAHWPGVSVLPFDGLLTQFVRCQDAQVIVRGLRSVTDFDYEAQLAGMNRQLAPTVDTVFLTPGEGLQHISSTLVREIALLDGNAEPFVAPHVWQALQNKRQERQNAS